MPDRKVRRLYVGNCGDVMETTKDGHNVVFMKEDPALIAAAFVAQYNEYMDLLIHVKRAMEANNFSALGQYLGTVYGRSMLQTLPDTSDDLK